MLAASCFGMQQHVFHIRAMHNVASAFRFHVMLPSFPSAHDPSPSTNTTTTTPTARITIYNSFLIAVVLSDYSHHAHTIHIPYTYRTRTNAHYVIVGVYILASTVPDDANELPPFLSLSTRLIFSPLTGHVFSLPRSS
mmetsp:Transcript_5386/g.14573  ORF Transcript_5386/g.14573 Transcript_5386/m.14573 type:complete len:138 (-) Transcript_5386:155-568(-)